MELSHLGDNLLARILSFLESYELLRSRAVCRKWRALALREDLWKTRWIGDEYFSGYNEQALLFDAVLRYVPCVYQLTLSPGKGGSLAHCPLLLGLETNCAAYALDLTCLEPEEALAAALTIRKQAALGRLRKLELGLDLNEDCGPKAEAERYSKCKAQLRTLLLEVVKLEGLEVLDVCLPEGALNSSDTLRWLTPSFVPSVSGPASLRELTYQTHESDPYFMALVEHHVSTLEELKATWHCPGFAPALARAPRLRKLTCPMVKSFDALQQCPSLTWLNITVDYEETADGRARLQDLQRFLEAPACASRVTDLRLAYEPDLEQAGVVNLVLSLADFANLRTLTLAFEDDDLRVGDRREPPLQLTPLLVVLPGLGQLQRLDVGGVVSDALLAAIAPDEDAEGDGLLSSLRLLVVGPPRGCAHQWLHRDRSLARTLRRNAALHVIVARASCPGDWHVTCCFCRDNASCHDSSKRYYWSGDEDIGFHGHGESVECSVCSDDRERDCHWAPSASLPQWSSG